MSEGFTITGAENIEKASLMALRAALKLEVRGLKRHGRPASVIVRERTGSTTRNKAKLYTEFNAWLGKPGRPPLIADRDGKLWLQGWAQLERCSGGDATMRVEVRADGIHVWEVPGRRYSRQQYAPGPAWDGLVPVAVLETGDSA